jgi:mRNA interferase RelE/StbE
MTFQVRIKKSAKKEINKLPSKVLDRIIPAIKSLEETPYPLGSKKLKGIEGHYWRIRIGDYRVIYEVYKGAKIIKVIRIAHRKDIYG